MGNKIFLYHHANACQHNKSLNVDHSKHLLNCAYAFIYYHNELVPSLSTLASIRLKDLLVLF